MPAARYTLAEKRAVVRDIIRLTGELGSSTVALALAKGIVETAEERGLTREEALQLRDDIRDELIAV